ncbi:MAG: cupredoxin domain-containing protein [Methylocystis sp.]
MRNVARHAAFSSLVLLAGARLASASESARVVIADLEFKPSVVTVRIGDTVTWINKDFVEHTATSREGAFDVATPKSRPAHWRARKVGEFSYYCRLHPNMTGTIRVTQ